MSFFEKTENRVKQIKRELILPNQNQPRQVFHEEELYGLSESIRCNGILQPLTVRKLPGGKYELIAGERRLRAAALACLSQVPCIVLHCDDQQSAIFALLENLQRVDLSPFEEAEGICRLIEEWNITQEEAALRLGKKQSTIANKLRLLKLSEEERERITAAGLTERHARALLKLGGKKDRLFALDQIIQEGLNVQQSEQLIASILESTSLPKKKPCQRTVVIKDVRIFMNTLNKAIATMRHSGIEAMSAQKETDDYIECVVRIPKAAALSRRPA